MKGDIEERLQSSSVRGGRAAFAGVLLFTVLMVSREGMKPRCCSQLHRDHQPGDWCRGRCRWRCRSRGLVTLRHRINLGLFFQVTAIFLVVFVVQLLVRGIQMSGAEHAAVQRTAAREDRRLGDPTARSVISSRICWSSRRLPG